MKPVRELRFSHNGKYLAFGPTPKGRGYVGLYDAETGKLLWSYETGDHVREIEFTADDKYVAVSSTDGYTYLFTINGNLLWKRYHGGYLPFMLKISENNDMIVVAGKGQELYAYDFNGNLLWSFEAPEVIQYGDTSSDLSRILIFSNSALYMLNREGKVLWWKKISPIGHNAIAMTPDGKYIVVGCMDALYLLNENGTTIWKFKDFKKGSGFHAKHPFLCAAQNVQISPDATKILAGFGETDRKLRFFRGEIRSTEKLEVKQPRKIGKADLDGDGKVDCEDLKILKKVYGLKLGMVGFKPKADLNGDNRIDIVDLAIFAFQYKQEKPSLPAGDVIPAKGPGIPPKGLENEDGPWNHRLLLAKSTDGVKWTKTFQILSDQASVPEVIVDHEGNLRVYYVDYSNGCITVAVSPDGGETWIYRKVKGLTPEWVDPDVVFLPDGRYRLYASYMPLKGPQDKIVSAISKDGINFTPEEGYRYHEPGSLLTDPDVFQFKGRWYMIVGPELTLLESEDGLTFKKVRKLSFGSGVSCTIPYGEGLRVYFHLDKPGPLKIYLSYTEDLKNWSKPEVVLAGGENSLDQYGVGDPAVAKLPSGGYIMVYKTWIQKPKQGEEMKTFKSKLESKAEKEQAPKFVGLLESILDAEKISDGCYLLKYPDFNLYMLWKPCELVKGTYSFKYGEITFLFDDENVFEILRSEVEEPKRIDKLKSRLEKLDNYIMLLVSDDGVNWRETGITVAKAATVPDIIVDKEGNLRVYYVSFPTNKIRVAISKDAKSWSQYDLEGIESGWVDPEVLLVNGNYILYSSWMGLAIARSEDGLNFKPILHSEELHVMDPTVFKVDGKWYMIAGPGTILFTSEDGLHFKQKKKLNLGGEVCDVMEKNGELWLYCHVISKEGSKILRFRSMDGETWTNGTVVYSSSKLVADPSVTFFQGKYYMVVTVSG
ncbi:MAG: hypothetical protein DRG31_04080 [Deltaproteobacteria bacterium]|nr:MAG: hypothetical protein DRG31_04080 [Deltaproteobacteria bacterium]